MSALFRLLLGRPLPTSADQDERLGKLAAIGAFGLDALSSVAYGPDEILYPLVLAGAAGVAFDIPIAIAIAGLLAIVALSYRQTIHAYPQGGGSFTVASENLGRLAGLTAAAALMVDYLTTVAVSVTAGTEAIIAFAPGLDAHRVLVDVVAILALMVVNLRGVREAGKAFILPTFIFIGSLALMILIGAIRYLTGHPPAPVHHLPDATEGVGLFLVLRAFAGGCTAMTGVEAIANGVPAFRSPESRNAARTLAGLAAILGLLFLGIVLLGRAVDAVPSDQANVIAQIGMAVVPGSPLFYLVQLAAAAILLLAANTSFNGFPRLAAVMARDGYFPQQFSHRGLRLAYSNGIVMIGLLAIVLVIVFGGSTHALIPLFAVGVFLCFTLSQAGMVVHWHRTTGPRRRLKQLVNGVGAATTATVTIVVASAKFIEGAWIILLLVPALVVLFWSVHRHYAGVARELDGEVTIEPAPTPQVLLPVRGINRATANALTYALSITPASHIVAVHVAADEDREQTEALVAAWGNWAPEVPLQVEPSPFRELLAPLLRIIEARQGECGGHLSVIIPEVVPRPWFQETLHNQLALALKIALLHREGIVVTSVPAILHARQAPRRA